MHGCSKAKKMLQSGELGDRKKQTTSAATPVRRRSRNGLRTGAERVRRRAHWHGRAQISQGLNCVAGAALSQGQVEISWQAQHSRKVK